MSLGLLASILMSILVAWYILKPHLLTSGFADNSMTQEDETRELTDRKERCVQLIKDLDLDYNTGKVATQEYERLRIELTNEMAHILGAIDQLSSK